MESTRDRRRPSQQAESALTISSERPNLKGRTNSAPLVQHAAAAQRAIGDGTRTPRNPVSHESDRTDGIDAQDEDEVAGVVGAVNRFQPFRTSAV